MKFIGKDIEEKEASENPEFKRVPELDAFLNSPHGHDREHTLHYTTTRNGVIYYCLTRRKWEPAANGRPGEMYHQTMCDGDEWTHFRLWNHESDHNFRIHRRVNICDKCLAAIGVDPSDYDEPDIDWHVKNATDPDKLMALSITWDMEEREYKLLYFKWHELMVKARKWTENWADYVEDKAFDISDHTKKYTNAGDTDPKIFVWTTLGWYPGNGKRIKARSAFRKWSQEWCDDRNRVSAARRVERLYYLLGMPDPPGWEQVKSMRACVETVEALREQGAEHKILYRLLHPDPRYVRTSIYDDAYDLTLQTVKEMDRRQLEDGFLHLLITMYRKNPKRAYEDVYRAIMNKQFRPEWMKNQGEE